MDKVVKVNVYLHDLRDYDAMNEVYRGRFGAKPPVRTTIAPLRRRYLVIRWLKSTVLLPYSSEATTFSFLVINLAAHA